MPLFAYQVLDKSGSKLTGKMDGEHDNAVSSRLKKMGYIVLEVNEEKASFLKNAMQKKSKVKIGQLSFFGRQLSAMLSAGIPLTRSLYTLSEQSDNPVLARVAGEIAHSVEGGMTFSEALNSHQEVFSKMYVDMVRAGEVGGMMEEMLVRLSTQLEKEKSLRDNIKSATFYPAVILVFASMIMLVMMFFIVPIFEGFMPKGVIPPLPTRIVFAISRSVRSYSILYFLGAIAIWFGVKTYMGSESGKNVWDRIKFSLPVFGDLFKKVMVARFSRTLSTLLSGGVTVMQALEAAGPASGSKKVVEIIKAVGEVIQQGQNMAIPLGKSGFFPPMLTNMVAVGEETGELTSMLTKVADFYEEEVATLTKGLTSMLEPIMLIVVGGVIGGVVIALYLPIIASVTSSGGK